MKAFIQDYDKILLVDAPQCDFEVFSFGTRLKVSKVTHHGRKTEILLGERLKPDTPCFITSEGKRTPLFPLGIYDCEEFNEKYSYDGALGVRIENGVTAFAFWSPFALGVRLTVGGETFDMERCEKGVWRKQIEGDFSGRTYTFTPSYYGFEELPVTDVYAPSTVDEEGYILPQNACPDGWESEHEKYLSERALKRYTDAVIWETHVRDFSSKTDLKGKGTYVAFSSEEKSVGGTSCLDYLADLGITHLHILPVAEFAHEGGKVGYNWGYNPKNYNAPTADYATARDGETKVRELREAISALHAKGIGVILDVVYNHFFDLTTPLARAVPYYYYRTDEYGEPTDGSGCGYETASERPMCRKFIIDSLMHWAKDYHVDGFRFDLMALHDVDTMKKVEKTLHAYNPSILLYGEPWVGGASALPDALRCDKSGVLKVAPTRSAGGVAVFSDVARDSIKGAVFNAHEGGYVNGRAYENVNLVKFSSMGATSPNFCTGWVTPSANCVVNYVSAHDNLTLWDKLTLTVPDMHLRLRANKMCTAIVMTSRGIPFMQGGEELLRTKRRADGSFDGNSYKSGDEVNGIEWKALVRSEVADMHDYYKGLIAFRRSHPSLRLTDGDEIENATEFLPDMRYDVIAYTLSACGETLLVVYNPLDEFTLSLPDGEWSLRINGDVAGDDEISSHVGKTTVAPKSVYVFVKK